MATNTWIPPSGDWFTGNGWTTAAGVLTIPPAAGDSADIYGGVTITAADAAIAGQGTLDGITIDFVASGGAVPTLDVANEQFGAAMLIDTPFASDAGVFIARGTVGFAGTMWALTGNTLTLDIEDSGGAARFANTGTVAASSGTLVVTGTTDAVLVNAGLLHADVTRLTIGTALTNTATGIVSASDAGTLTVTGPLANQGTIFASAPPGGTTYTVGTIDITGSLVNSGSILAAPFGVISATGGVANSGTITVAQQGTLTLGGTSDNTATIAVQGGTLTTTGAFSNAGPGTIGLNGSAMLDASGTLTNQGTISAGTVTGTIASPASIDITGSLVNAGVLAEVFFGSVAATGGVANSGTITDAGGTMTLGGGVANSGTITVAQQATLTLGGTSDNTATIAVQGGTLTTTGAFSNAGPGTIGLNGSAMLDASGTLTNQGTISAGTVTGTIASPASIDITGSLVNAGVLAEVFFGSVAATGGVANSGTITDAGGTMTLGGGVANSGTISDTAGTVTIAGAVSGNGTIQIADHVTLDGAVGAGQVIDFGTATDATLDLGDVGAFSGTIANLTGHDIVDLNAAATGSTFDAASHVLTVLNGTSAVASFVIASGGTSLNATPDGHGGTVLTLQQIGSAAQVENYMVQNDANVALGTTAQTHGWATPNPTVYYTFEPGSTLTAADQGAFRQAMTLYSDVADISFATADASHAADLFLTSNASSQAETSWSSTTVNGSAVATSATISIDTTVPGWTDLSDLGTNDPSGFGGSGFSTVLHEMGHAIGFGHPGPYNDGGVTADFVSAQIFYTDTRQYSVMSYIAATQSGADWQSGTTSVHAQTPMLYDIGAAQQIYGANTLTLHGGDTFGFNSSFGTSSAHPLSVYDFNQNTVPVVTLYDGGGGNTLDLSGFSAASYVNLAPGSFTSADGLTDNIAIAADTTIDSAIGGSGNDVFTLNAFADTIDGGGGFNTVVLNAPEADYTVHGGGGTITLTDTLNGVTDTLTNISLLQFSGVTQAAPCFMRGTTILTARGDIAVQALRPGEDRVVTRDGRLAPVKWVGWRVFEAARHPRPEDVMPVRVRAGAIAAGRPRRDLLLSPDHALALDGVLIPVRYLINGATIVQEMWAGRIAYYHVELDRHDVLLAEGVAAESYLDTGNRDAFANGSGAAQLHPAFAPDAAAALRIWAHAGCARLVADGPLLAAARARIAAQATGLGYRVTTDPALCATADGRVLALRQEGGTWHAMLPRRTARVRLRSRVFVPLHMDAAGADPRRLGIAVAALRLDDRAVALDDARLLGGWRAAEPGWRWTDGAADLDTRGVRRLAFRVVSVGSYWLAPEPHARRSTGRPCQL